ncbi:MAG: 1-acyl-sn-glycerol-3-phosphate acyltransferase [Chlorobi bacterium]|nr:1-acyl-sn-glycerol-3-phosphate acyltransferase [Chlorobiota bacterium]
MKNKKHYPTSKLIRLITHIVFWLFTKYYGIKKNMPAEIKKLEPPYLVLGNHAGYWDPFITGYFLPRFTHFVSSDAAFRNPVNRFFLKKLGTIPKKKSIRDTKVIRDIISVIKQGENVGIFAEGTRTWAGNTLPVDPSIAKLIKMLNVPVTVPILKGMNLFNPRWAYKIRRTKVEIEYKLLFTEKDIKQLSENEIYEKFTDALQHDETEYQRIKKHKIHSRKRAEYINHALYLCPECKAIDTFSAKGNDFYCRSCGYDIHIDKYGFFERKSFGKLYFDNIKDWFNFQQKKFAEIIEDKIKKSYNDIIFEDKKSKVYIEAENKKKLIFAGTADIKLYPDKIKIDFKEKEKVVIMNFNDLQTINPQVKEQLEILYKNKAYRITGNKPGVSSLKWETAANIIFKHNGQTHKLSSYLNIK